jgi:hypothetical protein
MLCDNDQTASEIGAKEEKNQEKGKKKEGRQEGDTKQDSKEKNKNQSKKHATHTHTHTHTPGLVGRAGVGKVEEGYRPGEDADGRWGRAQTARQGNCAERPDTAALRGKAEQLASHGPARRARRPGDVECGRDRSAGVLAHQDHPQSRRGVSLNRALGVIMVMLVAMMVHSCGGADFCSGLEERVPGHFINTV